MKRINVRVYGCLIIATACSLAWAGTPDNEGSLPSNDWGVLVMAHGGSDAWDQAVEDTVAPLLARFPIEIAFGMAKTSTLRDAARRLETQGVKHVAVVRMFISGDSFLEPTEYILGLRDTLPDKKNIHHAGHHKGAHDGHDMHARGSHGGGHHMEPPEPIKTELDFVLSWRGVGESPLVDEILVDRVKDLSSDPNKESVLILAHGPADEAENERWLANMRLRAQKLHNIGPFRHIECETLREDWPVRRTEAERRIRTYVKNAARDGGRCIVVPFRVGGFGPYRKVLEGLEYAADGRPFCPHPNMTRWIEATARECFSDNALSRR